MGVVSLGDISHLIFHIVFVVVQIQSLEEGAGRTLQLLSQATFTAGFFSHLRQLKAGKEGEKDIEQAETWTRLGSSKVSPPQ